MNKKDNIKRIQITHEILVNRQIPHEAIYLLIHIKNKASNNHVRIYSSKLINELNWKDTRTLKKYLNILYDIGEIDTQYKTLPKHKPLEFNINPIGKHFTQVDIDTINKIKELCQETPLIVKGKETILNLQEMSLRLFYLYEKYYNKQKGKAYPEYKQIVQDTGMSSKHIKVINDWLELNGILEIEHGEYYVNEDEETRKGRNQYIPICNRKA